MQNVTEKMNAILEAINDRNLALAVDLLSDWRREAWIELDDGTYGVDPAQVEDFRAAEHTLLVAQTAAEDGSWDSADKITAAVTAAEDADLTAKAARKAATDAAKAAVKSHGADEASQAAASLVSVASAFSDKLKLQGGARTFAGKAFIGEVARLAKKAV